MQNVRLSRSRLTDGSKVYAVKFDVTHEDNKLHTVTLECNSDVAAQRLLDALLQDVAYAESDLRS